MESLTVLFQVPEAVNSVRSLNFFVWSSKPIDTCKDRSKEIEQPGSVAETFSPLSSPRSVCHWSTTSSTRSSFNDNEADLSSNSNWDGASFTDSSSNLNWNCASLDHDAAPDQRKVAALEHDAISPDSNAILAQTKDATALQQETVVPEVSEIKTVFDRFDENGDGLICAKDLARFVQRLGFNMSLAEARRLVQSVDRNSDGRLDFEEFYSLYKSLGGCLEEGRLTKQADGEDDEDENTFLQAFKVYDKNNNGYICATELQHVLKQMGLPEGNSRRRCERVIQTVAANPRNGITLPEFKSMMCSKSASSCRRKSSKQIPLEVRS